MVARTYTHAQMTDMLEQFKRLPPKFQSDFLAHVAANPELGGNPNALAGAMQAVINQAAQMVTPAHPFASLVPPGIFASLASLNGAVPSVDRGDSGQLTTQMASRTQQRGNDDLAQSV